MKHITLGFLTLAMLLGGCGASRKAVAGEGRGVHTYDSYRGLVMAGYQGWFAAEGDDSHRGFYHYKGHDGFRPGSASVDMWPDMSEYKQTYVTPFRMPDGSEARVFSSYDSTTVATHFRWMREYGLDGVFMQRFVSEIKTTSGARHFNHVLDNAMRSAIDNGRAICVMYDLSGMHPGDQDFILSDIDSLAIRHKIFNREANPSYLWHNGRPMVSVWGVGFSDKRAYSLDDCIQIIDGLRSRGYSVMIGVPTFWRDLDNDTEADSRLHDLIKRCDVVMPWFVARFGPENYDKFEGLVPADLEWCRKAGVDYAPLVFPGFSWKNMYGADTRAIPRQEGRFIRRQIDNAISSGAEMLYVAMFDEIDEGTAIFKCASEVPVDSCGTKFVKADGAGSDHYLKIVGEAASRMKHNKRKGH